MVVQSVISPSWFPDQPAPAFPPQSLIEKDPVMTNRVCRVPVCAVAAFLVPMTPAAMAGGLSSPLEGIEVILYQADIGGTNPSPMSLFSFDNPDFDPTYGDSSITGDRIVDGSYPNARGINMQFAQYNELFTEPCNVFGANAFDQQDFEVGTEFYVSFILDFQERQAFQGVLDSGNGSRVDEMTVVNQAGQSTDLTTLAVGTEFEVGSYAFAWNFTIVDPGTGSSGYVEGYMGFDSLGSTPVVPGAGIGLTMLAGVAGVRRRRGR